MVRVAARNDRLPARRTGRNLPRVVGLNILIEVCKSTLKSACGLRSGAYAEGAREARVVLVEQRTDTLVVEDVGAGTGKMSTTKSESFPLTR